MRTDAVSTVVRDAFRGLRAARSTTALSFVILTLAIAAGTVTFSVVDAVALRPLPYGNPSRLVGISSSGAEPGRLLPLTPQDYFALVDGAQAFTGIGASRPGGTLQFAGDATTEPVRVTRVTANLFDVLDVRPAAGRWFGPEHERTGAASVILLSYDLWVRRFRADPSVIGKTLAFADGPREVVGIVSAGVWYPAAGTPPDAYVPYIPTARDRLSGPGRTFILSVVARMKPGVSAVQARADVVRVFTSPVVVLPLLDQVVGPARGWLLLVLAAVAFVLVIACANVASLLLARASTRTPEFATREALGASRRRLAVGLMIEGVLLAAGSGTTAIVVSLWGVALVKASLPAGLLTRTAGIQVDGRVMFVSLATALTSGILFGAAPAWTTARADLFALMKTGRNVVGDRRVDRSLGVLLIAEVAFVCVLMVGTTLAVRTFVHVATMDLGFDRRNVVGVSYVRSVSDVPAEKLGDTAAALRVDLLERAKSVPGVMDAAIEINSGLPLQQGGVQYGFSIPGYGDVKGDDMFATWMVTPDYFRVMGMQLVRGRVFDKSDRNGAPLVMLINDVAARRFFQGRDPVGQTVTFRGPTTIVGVLRAIRFHGPEANERPEMYVPADQEPGRYQTLGGTSFGTIVLRVEGSAPAVASAVREAIRPALGGRESGQPQLLDKEFAALTAGRRFNAGVMSSFGVVALLIAAMGVYSTMAFLVARQTRGIGVRLALGASKSRIVRLILSTAVRRLSVGGVFGLAVAWLVSGVFSSLIFGFETRDPWTYSIVALAIGFTGLVGAYMPALRACRIDPIVALRQD